ncbi:MAG: PEGA domain-containing protein [Acidobacteriota bacterium]
MSSEEAALDPLNAFASEDEIAPARPPQATSERRGSVRIRGVHVALIVLCGVIIAQAAWILGTWGAGPPGTPVAAASLPAPAPPPALVADQPAQRQLQSTRATVRLAALHVSTEPPSVQVWVDDQARGVSPVTVRDLAAGPHTVRVMAGGTTLTRVVRIEPGVDASLIVSLRGPAEFASGWLAVSSPIPVEIVENGTPLGDTDTPRIMIAAGQHTLETSNTELGYRAQHSVLITAGQTTALAITLPSGSLSVNALPWAEVWIDGRQVGETPLANLSVPIGRREVTFRHPDLGEQRRTVTVSLTGATRVGIDLRKAP